MYVGSYDSWMVSYGSVVLQRFVQGNWMNICCDGRYVVYIQSVYACVMHIHSCGFSSGGAFVSFLFKVSCFSVLGKPFNGKAFG